ncbi:MAG: ABC transporter ATP-binding protein/permease [Gemmataceae bacterium]|nr:ABC transporter ATP-binding protein/permease [Gemmataceae bacterium]
MARQLTQGQLIAAELIVGLVIGSFLKLNKYLDAWYDLCTAVAKLSMVTDLPLERKGGASFSCSDGIEVRVKELSYEGQHRILDQLSWSVEAGQKVALSGRSGTGKSVLLDVIAGLREPTTGIIELDGIDLRDLELESIRREVAHVGGVEIFAGTIMENLRVGRDGIGLHQIREALTTVGLERTIQNLPNGLQTTLIPTGSPLSFSQSLRLCIARAILGNPRLLILDGVLDLIDLSDSKLLLDVLFSKQAPWTLIVATRSARVIERCDKVIGLEPQASLN